MMEPTVLQKALISIKKLKKMLNEQRNKNNEPIAIIGLSCRFPQASNKEEYWALLREGKNVISTLPEERWQLLSESNEIRLRNKQHPYWGGYLTNIAAFDAYFFGISPREALRMDPQQRLLLEVTQEAIDDAGLSKDILAGSNTGVFASLYASQFGYLQQLDSDLDALYIPTGNATSIAANRLSYLYDLRGPSIVLDTACSSSLVAVHLACLHLQNQLCDMAIVGAANINLLPSINVVLSQAKMLSQDGQCKTFDAHANGYVQGEGVGVIVLKSLTKALQDKDSIYAVISGSAVNQDGKTNGLTAPNGLLQEDVLKAAYKKANVTPNDISYVECHGTGTFLGDPIEIQALGEVVGHHRSPDHPCWIGSVKTNIGHLEPAAGMASLIKVALSLKYAKIPPHLHFSTPNPHIAFDKYHFKIPQTLIDWPSYRGSRIAGVSGFGFGGTNAHMVLREVSEQENQNARVIERSMRRWQHKSYWPSLKNPLHSEKPVGDSILQAKHILSPLSTLQFEFIFDTNQMPELRDTYNIVHAGYYLEMLAYVANTHDQTAHFSVTQLEFLSALIVPTDVAVKVQLVLNALDNDNFSFCFYSYSSVQQEWTEHAKGEFHLKPISHKIMDSIDFIKQRCPITESADTLYQRILAMGMPAGDSIRWTHQYGISGNEILCAFQTPLSCKKDINFQLSIHPGIIDGCIQPIFKLLPADFNKPYMAASIGKITWLGVKEGPLYLLGVLDQNISSGEKIQCDCYLLTQDNQLIAVFEQVTLNQLHKKIQIEHTLNNAAHFDFSMASSEESKKYIIQFLIEQVNGIFSIPEEDIAVDVSLSEMGMDSLMAIVLMRSIETNLNVTCTLKTLQEGLTITELADIILPYKKQLSGEKNKKTHLWFPEKIVHSHAQIRLFCFPYGGGGASIYRDWQDAVPEIIDVCPVQLPGREERLDEIPINNMATLIQELAEHIQPKLDLPFAFFGHSFGSLIAFELTRYLRKKNLSQPVYLFFSAFPNPRTPTQNLDNLLMQLEAQQIYLSDLVNASSITALSDEKLQLLALIFQQNGILDYEHHLTNKDIIKILLPVFIGDMSIVKSYQYHEESPLNLPITVFVGKQDAWISYEDQLTWAEHTQNKCEIIEFDSGHLFIKDASIKEVMLQTIAKMLRGIRETECEI